MESSFSIADTESLQATNNEQQRAGLGLVGLDAGHNKWHMAQEVSRKCVFATQEDALVQLIPVGR